MTSLFGNACLFLDFTFPYNLSSLVIFLCCALYLVTQSCPTLRDSMDCSPQASLSIGSLQVRILEWVAISFSKESFQPRDWTHISHISGRFFMVWAPGKPKPTNLKIRDFFLVVIRMETMFCTAFCILSASQTFSVLDKFWNISILYFYFKNIGMHTLFRLPWWLRW